MNVPKNHFMGNKCFSTEQWPNLRSEDPSQRTFLNGFGFRLVSLNRQQRVPLPASLLADKLNTAHPSTSGFMSYGVLYS